ncbi:uncharacterized protein tasor2 [Notolabrus celidotus]|uniref:uncharacterized protein tasor2 n=1 Tax=Notolabrus celidotus TaxID=1203425 RepID=UPI00148FFECF|nr:uncharacterized protein tasor2 [Notolabrus celidotus]
MESGNGGASSKGVLVPVPESSDAFHNSILAPLKSAYLYEESKLSFKYNSAFLVKNPALEKKYNAFRAKRKAAGYSEEDLKESYGFLLFDDVSKANTLGESGVLTGNSSCTTLGNPSNGIYISMYSDCLDLNRWYHGKSGYIAIIRLTKGRVKNVSENYTQDFTAPTTGFDCHVSDQLPSVSDKTSSFLAFERTQYYMYELLDDGSNETAQSPSAACPYAVVSFSYTDTKAAHVAPQENSEEKKLVCHYIMWRGQLQICDQFYDVRLRSTSGASLPAKLPPVVKADRAISMLTLRQMLPRAVFETCHSVFLDELWCSHCEFVSSEVEETNSLSHLLFEIKKTDVALTVPLNDGGFLFLVHSSHFLMYDDTGSCVPEVLQGVFVFPDSRVISRDTKCGHRKPAMSSEILRVLPVLSYAEGEAEKTPIDPSEELSEVLAQHMQSYAALINPGLDIIPSREVSIFADQYDVPDAHKHLYTSPEWTNRAWQSLKSYLSKPVSFQLPLAKASEILMVGQENRMEDLEDDIYICLSSPEEAPANDAGICSEDQLAGQTSSVNVETSVDSLVTSVEAPLDLSNASQNVAPCDVQAGGSDKDTETSELGAGIKTDVKRTKNLIPSTSDELPAELIVSITSAERTDENVIRNESATKHNGTQISDFSTAKSNAARVNPLNDEADKTTKVLDSSELNNLTKTKQRKVRRGPFKRPQKVSNGCVETDNLPTVKTPVENDNFKSQEDNLAKEPEDHQQLSNPPVADWRKVRRRKRIFGKLSPRSKKMKPCTPGVTVSEEEKADPEQQTSESTILIEMEALPLRRKTERWDLKPVVSTCGRILVPHGSADVADKIKSLQDELQSTTNDKCHEKMLVVASMEAKDTVEIDHELNGVPETAGDEREKDEDKENPHGHVSPEHSISGLFDASNDSSNVNPESSEQSTKIEVTDTSSSQAVQEKHSDTLPSVKCSTKGEFLLSKLKSVLLRGKRKIDLLGSEQTAGATAQDTESCLELSKVDSETSILKSNDTITSVEDANLGYNEVSRMLSVDPIFAFALGLTPIGIPKMAQKTDSLSTEQRKDLSQTQEQTVFDKQPQIILRPPSIFPRRGRIKTLKKHQDVSAENVKKKWWLHFQTPASYASDKLNNKQYDKNNSVRKTVKEKLSSSCPSTDALTLLADLALSASHDQVPTQPDPALGRQPETSLKKVDLVKDVTSVDQESVLHALLRQPAVRPIQPVESPSPSHLVGGSELVDLVSKEHAYSLPPSSSLPLGLPGTPFQVSPLSGSTGLLHHQKTMYDDGSRPQHPSVLKDGGEHNFGTSEFLKKNIVHRRKFRHSRTFVSKDGSIQVTKQWEENYDFNQDSKFASDPKDKAIIRALHGPWDQSLQDTSEEVRLIVHMWIGLFYSRSTARFFHIDPDVTPDVTHPCSEESGSLEMSSAVVSSSDQSELKAISDEPLPNVTDASDPSTVKALDLSKKDDSASDHGSSILDLSLKNPIAEVVTSDLQVNKKVTHVSRERKEASNPLNTQPSKRPQEASPFQVCREIVLSTQAINGMNHLRGPFTGFYTPLQFQLTSVSSFKDVALIPVQNANKSVPILPGNFQTAGIALMLQGCDKVRTDMKHGMGNSKAIEIGSVQPHGRVSSESMADDLKKEAVTHTDQHDDIEAKPGKNLQVSKKSHQEEDQKLYPKPIQTGGDATNKELEIACNGNPNENEKQLVSEEHMEVSQGKAASVKEDGNLCSFNESNIKDEPSGKKDGLGEKDTCVSAVNAKTDVSNQPSSMKCDDRNSVKRDSITKCVKEDGILCTFNESNIKDDLSGKEGGLGEKDTCVSTVNAKSDVSNQPSSMKCDDRNSVKRDSIPKCVKEDGILCTFNESNIKDDPSGKEGGLGEKDTCVSTVNAKSDVSNQPSSMKSDDRNLVKMDSIPKCDGQANSDVQPPQADKKEEAAGDLQSSEMCANGSVLTAEHAITEKAPPTPPKMEVDLSKPAVEEDESVPETNDSIETGSKNKVEASFNNGSDGHGNCDTKSVIGEHMADNQTQTELLTNQSHSSQRETIEPETEKAETKETDLISGETNKGLGESHSRIIIPFIGIDISREDILQPHDSHSQGNVDKSVQSQAGKVLISETTLPETVKPSDVSSAAQLHSKKAELSSGKSPLLGIPDINPLWASGSESDDRCPTPTMDEKPYRSGGKSSKNVTPKCVRRSSVTAKEEKPVEQKPSLMSAVNGDLDTHHGLHPDLEARTLRVLQSIDKFLSKSNSINKPGQIKTADMKQKPQTSNPNSKYILTSCLKDFKDQKMGNKKSAAVSAPTSQELQTEASGNFLILPYKNKMEEVLGVGLQHTHTDTSVHQRYFERTERSRQTSSGHDICYPHQSHPSTGCLVAMDPTTDQDRHATSQANLSHDPHPFSQRPVMAVKPSKSEESQADCLSNNRLSENSMLSNFPPNKQTKTSLVPFASPTTKLLENKTQCFKINSEGLDYRTQETCERLPKSSWMSHDSESNKATFAYQDPLCQYQGRDFSKFNKVSASSLPVQTFVSAKMGPQLVDLKQAVMNSSAEKVGQTAKESLEIDQRNCSSTSSSLVDYKDDDMDDSLYLGPDSSLSCTVYNTRGKRSYSLLEQLSQRCIQDDPTEASMEQECLIFSEKMKQLLKRTKMGLDHQLDAHGKSNLSCPSPVSVHFSGLEEQDVTVDHLDGLSVFGQKIKVDMSDRKDLEDLTEKRQTLNSKKSCKGAGTPIEHAGVSALTAECAELYEATMNNVCAVRDVPSKPKLFKMDRGYPKAEPSKYFDFCDQMKREMDESFRSSLNSVVKKSCKTKYRFYILETSDDAFFEETKAQLKAEGHTAVQPSEFFFSDGSPSLLIILRNEDISEHICEVPHLLELKKCPGVQFAGIDESDDVVNLTHQELFTRGGFIMLDRAALEPLSLCDLKKMSEILQELCKTGKWKWMLHYRDSRRLKENARLSAEAKEKQNFLNWCQEAGILEVLPYHECDLMSRDLPDYLTCLVRLQVQNITARFTVFITDATADSAEFDSNGIITMTFSSFLTYSPSEAFSV